MAEFWNPTGRRRVRSTTLRTRRACSGPGTTSTAADSAARRPPGNSPTRPPDQPGLTRYRCAPTAVRRVDARPDDREHVSRQRRHGHRLPLPGRGAGRCQGGPRPGPRRSAANAIARRMLDDGDAAERARPAAPCPRFAARPARGDDRAACHERGVDLRGARRLRADGAGASALAAATARAGPGSLFGPAELAGMSGACFEALAARPGPPVPGTRPWPSSTSATRCGCGQSGLRAQPRA